MKVKYYVKICLTEKEAIAIKKLLGKFSDIDKKGLGLNEKEIKMSTNLYNKLPNKDDD